MADSFVKRAAAEYAKTMRKKALEANLKRASAAVKTRILSSEHAQVIVPDSEAPNAQVFNYGKRHPLNFKNQVEAKHPKSYMRYMGRTPHRPFLAKTKNDIATADRALDAGAKDLIESDWDKDW